MKLRPLSGLSPPTSAAAAQLVSPPYDAVSPSVARSMVANNTGAFLRVVLPEVFLPDSTADDESAQHTASSAALDSLAAAGLLAPAPAPSFFVYELRVSATGHSQTGVAALVSIDDYVGGVIKKHEHTRANKELQRAGLAGALRAHTGPVLLAHRADAAVASAVRAATAAGPPALAVEQAGVAHTLWKVPATMTRALEEAFAAVEGAYIADGHHRAAAAARVGVEQRAVGGTQMERRSDWFPAVLFPAADLVSRPYFRAVKDLGKHQDAAAFLGELKTLGVECTELMEAPEADAKGEGEVFMVIAGAKEGTVKWFRIELGKSDGKGECVYGRLQEKVLGPALDVVDVRTDPRVEFVGGVEVKELAGKVTAGEAKVAFAPSAVGAEEMMKVVDSGSMMPPKSTWFEPKLCSGFFVHTF